MQVEGTSKRDLAYKQLAAADKKIQADPLSVKVGGLLGVDFALGNRGSFNPYNGSTVQEKVNFDEPVQITVRLRARTRLPHHPHRLWSSPVPPHNPARRSTRPST